MMARARLVSLLLMLALAVCTAPGAAVAQSETDPAVGSDWTGPLVAGAVDAIFTPAGGALLVRTSDGLLRSDDGAQTFRAIPLPPAVTPAAIRDRVISVDPVDQDVLYATGDELLYQSVDSGSSWRAILTQASHPGFEVTNLVASPAAPSVLYAALVDRARTSFILLTSHDRGASWTTLQSAGPLSLCGWGVHFFQAHPSDAMRVFLASGCFAGRNFGTPLQQSTDAGKTFQDWWTSDEAGGVSMGFPRSLVGGLGAEPARWYLAVNRDPRVGGSQVVRSDDDGSTWAPVLTYNGAGTFEPGSTDPNVWEIQIAGLAYVSSMPDTLYVARTASSPADQSVQTSGVTTSTDGGATWSDLGGQQLGQLADLALGIDGQNLYVASDQGLFRLALNR